MPGDIVSVALERALDQDGCPVCRLVLEHERQWLWILLWENVNDPGIRERIIASCGFCHRHAWALASVERNDFGNNLGTAIIYEHLVNRSLEHCGVRPAHQNGRNRPLAAKASNLDQVSPGRSCPACAAKAGTERYYVNSFAAHCAEDGFALLYGESDGLCLAHLQAALGVSSPPVRVLLLTTQSARLERARSQALAGENDPDYPPFPGAPVRQGIGLLAGADPSLAADGRRDLPPDNLPDGKQAPPRTAGGCFVCAAERAAELRRLSALLSSGRSVRSSPAWLCAEHAWRLDELAAGHCAQEALGAWCAGLIDTAIDQLDSLLLVEQLAAQRRPLLPWWPSRHAAGPQPQQCVACAAQANAGRRQAVETLDPANARARADPTASLDLCLRHFGLAVKAAQPSLVTTLRRQQLQKLQALSLQLREYIRKRDWNHRDEPCGEEQSAWRRAVALFVGDA